MALPTRAQIEIPLLKTISEFGGSAEPQKLYTEIAKFFPYLRAEEK
jgi:hypothetical protein